MTSVVFFASDRAEIAQIRRIRHFRQAGYEVSSFSMAKRDGQNHQGPDWPDVDLGEIENENLPKRMLRAVLSLGRIWQNRARIQQADVIVARNIDMVLLAWLARLVAWSGAPIVYECLDIHGIFTGTGAKSTLARAVERSLLTRITLLVVSSPGFIQHYFAGQQGYRGPWELLENKLVFDAPPLPRPETARSPKTPLVLGWVGTIRCRPSLLLLAETAAALPQGIVVRIHGMVHHHVIPDFDAIVARHPNIEFCGPYRYPDGLAAVYQGCDLVWAQDLWQEGANSTWLLPNRIYEASWFGCPSIAVASTQTGQTIADRGLGFTVDRADPEALITLLQALTPEAITAAGAHLLQAPDSAFCLTTADITRIVEAATAPDASRFPPSDTTGQTG